MFQYINVIFSHYSFVQTFSDQIEAFEEEGNHSLECLDTDHVSRVFSPSSFAGVPVQSRLLGCNQYKCIRIQLLPALGLACNPTSLFQVPVS